MKPNKILMSEEDCEAICLYLNSGFTFQHAIDLIKNKKNQRCIENMLRQLEGGHSVDEVMMDLCPKRYRKMLPALLKLLPFSKALQLALTLTQEQAIFKRQTMSEGVYPLFLLIATWGGVALFTFFCFPILLSLMTGFGLGTTSLILIQSGLKLFCVLVFVFILCLICGSACLMVKKTQVSAYIFFCKVCKGNLIQQYHSNLFARFYIQCLKNGCKTKEILKLLNHIPSYPLCQLFSQSIESQLEGGVAFYQAITHIPIESTLMRVLQIAMVSSSMESYLEGYLVTSQYKMKRQMKRITKGFQLLSYCSIGVVVIVVYQVLILPLSLMAEL